MASEGIAIHGKVYPFPKSMRIGESRMIKQITGMNPSEFEKALKRLKEDDNPDVALAMVWWCVHREDPAITVEDLEELDWEALGQPQVSERGNGESGTLEVPQPVPVTPSETPSVTQPSVSESSEPVGAS